jgi:hypothetical protein
MHFHELQRQLIAALRSRVENGEFSERRLAHLTGISQPHIHNVLKGERILSNRAADAILHRLGLTVMDLLGQQATAAGKFCPGCGEEGRFVEVPVLEGRLGPGLPLPQRPSRLERHPFFRSFLASVDGPQIARLADDPRMAGLFRENDLVLLDRSPSRRLNPGKSEYFVVSRHGEGIVRRLRVERDDLLLLRGAAPEDSAPVEALPLGRSHLLDVVKARIAWVGRSLPAHGLFGPSATWL